jgi:hypothetical protein
MEKPEITIKSISGGIYETRKTGEYPDYYTVRSRKYKKSWRVKEFPVDLKFKGEVVYNVIDEDTVLDNKGEQIDYIDFVLVMRD